MSAHKLTWSMAGIAAVMGMALANPAVGQAEEPVCPVGTYWNPALVECLPYGVNPVIVSSIP